MNSFTQINQSKLHMSFRDTIRVSNSLDPDQNWHSVGPDLGLSTTTAVTSMEIVKELYLSKRDFKLLSWWIYSLGSTNQNCTWVSETPSECQTVWIQTKTDILSVLIWVQTVWKDYQQMTNFELKSFTCQKGIFSFCHDKFVHSDQPIKTAHEFQKQYQSVKQFRSKPGLTFCWSWSGSKLFAKDISRTTVSSGMGRVKELYLSKRDFQLLSWWIRSLGSTNQNCTWVSCCWGWS